MRRYDEVNSSPHALLSGEELVEQLHKHGINLRHCGRVRMAVPSRSGYSIFFQSFISLKNCFTLLR